MEGMGLAGRWVGLRVFLVLPNDKYGGLVVTDVGAGIEIEAVHEVGLVNAEDSGVVFLSLLLLPFVAPFALKVVGEEAT